MATSTERADLPRSGEFLSTPSGWRATRAALDRLESSGISIRALRVEGDFLDTYERPAYPEISIHALRVEGDKTLNELQSCTAYFYPRPPGGGRRIFRYLLLDIRHNFYPRPPGGGRLNTSRLNTMSSKFYPRPPGGGRPSHVTSYVPTPFDFYPRPPGGGRHQKHHIRSMVQRISIHALRVEGDGANPVPLWWSCNFYPRPPGGGRHLSVTKTQSINQISIHALRVEGDIGSHFRTLRGVISIHALRVEGDIQNVRSQRQAVNFYPRPPGGGRLCRAGLPCAP